MPALLWACVSVLFDSNVRESDSLVITESFPKDDCAINQNRPKITFLEIFEQQNFNIIHDIRQFLSQTMMLLCEWKATVELYIDEEEIE